MKISEGFFIDIIDLLESFSESGFSEFTSLLMVVHNLVVEDREVKSKSKSNWVAGVQGLGAGLGKLIVLEGSVLDGVELITLGALSNVSVVVTDHLVEESFGLIGGGNSHA